MKLKEIFMISPYGMDSLLKFIDHINTVHPTITYTSDISDTEISFLDLTIYIQQSELHTKLYTKTTDRHMYMNYFSEHPMYLKKSIPYSQFLRLKRIHSEPQYLLEAQINMYLFFRWREYTHDIILETSMKTKKFTKEQLLTTGNSENKDMPLTFITTYNRSNPNFKELFSKHWAYLGRSSASRKFGKRDFLITNRKPPSLKNMLVRAKIVQPRNTTYKGCKRPNTCKYCKKISQSGKIKNLHNNKTYNTVTKGTCQSNNLIYSLECNWCHIKYVGQTKNRIIDRFQGHIFDIKHNHSTTVGRHFESQSVHLDPNMTIHILEYVRLPKDLQRSNSLRDNRELVWIHRLNTLLPNGLNILDWGNEFRMNQEYK